MSRLVRQARGEGTTRWFDAVEDTRGEPTKTAAELILALVGSTIGIMHLVLNLSHLPAAHETAG
ncbi:MAG: hypothetical protein CME06_06875 [Gemmatimonadetes bacterium]|nr:hypothetical protein [Gemmatimonadota bacterium]